MDNTSNPLTLQPRRPLSFLTVEDTSDLPNAWSHDTLHDTASATAPLDGYTACTQMLLMRSWSMLTDSTDSPVFWTLYNRSTCKSANTDPCFAKLVCIFCFGRTLHRILWRLWVLSGIDRPSQRVALGIGKWNALSVRDSIATACSVNIWTFGWPPTEQSRKVEKIR